MDQHKIEVTKVDVYPFKEGAYIGHMKAIANIVLNDQLLLRGLRVMDSENGLFVGYPFDPFRKGDEYKNIFFPITAELRHHIEKSVLEKYDEATKEAK
ncbi:SpoVG family protein [uncultured Fibrobacter sp.]|uniref:SpoVG family protein n=1 Tax=uncultured Fibrobacter sp. TaxID=261512 RepID=UPI002599234E|nr:SpoVG family protein [uncultured Fibrobacter sp.]